MSEKIGSYVVRNKMGWHPSGGVKWAHEYERGWNLRETPRPQVYPGKS